MERNLYGESEANPASFSRDTLPDQDTDSESQPVTSGMRFCQSVTEPPCLQI